jgi:anti-sigma factor RsiW
MSTSGGQLCARARFWASLRVDGELSELEGALLDAHLGRCGECREFEASATGSAVLLREAPLAVPSPVVVQAARSPRRVLLVAGAAAAVIGAALLGGLVNGAVAPGSPTTARSVAVVASVETPDQLRRLRRTSLLNERPLPRDISSEPV